MSEAMSRAPADITSGPYQIDTSKIENSLLIDLARMAFRDALKVVTGSPYDPKGRNGGSLEGHSYAATRELSRLFYLFNVPHEVWVDESRDDTFWWVVANAQGFRWHCHLCGTDEDENWVPGPEVATIAPVGVDTESEGVHQIEPWESDEEWWWNPLSMRGA